MATKPSLTSVHSFWNTEACDTHVVEPAVDDIEFFTRFREQRYRTQWHLPLLVPFAEARGKKVLEIGIGNGADGVMFALNGADYTGVDLTEAALEATSRHFQVLGLPGTFRRENAECLGFADETFDLVYSHGVLHHTPNTRVAVDEVYRVLKPGGQAIIMLYHKHSFNYYVRIMTWMRLRVLFAIFLRSGRPRRVDKTHALSGVRGNRDTRVWKIHYQNFRKEGWSYLRAKNFVHHCTDGPECPIAYAFNRSEAQQLFSRFSEVRTKIAHFPLKRYSRWLPFALEEFLAPRIGWYLFVFATKAPQPLNPTS
jgi:ubiquinone/menaquinone biosynthesis C-methylase UbiE